jgi:hypothetical protein
MNCLTTHSIEIERLSQLPRRLGFAVLERDTRCIRDLHHRVERSDDRRSIHERCRSERVMNACARGLLSLRVAHQHRFGEFDQQCRMCNPRAVAIPRDNARESERLTFVFAARTEQRGVTDGSVVAVVERGDAPCHQLDLRMR